MIRNVRRSVSKHDANDQEETIDMQTIDKEKARQGETTGRMRYVLAVSLVAAVLAMIMIGLSF